MAEERKVLYWITVNGKHVPVYEDQGTTWMPMELRERYSRYIDDHSHDHQLDSDELSWVAALRYEKYGKQDDNKKDSQIQKAKEEADRLNAMDKEEVIKPWSKAEEKRSKEISKYITDKIRTGDSFQEFYEENAVEDIYKESLNFEGYRDDEISITKMNLIYAQNWDEEDRRVKQGKAVTGSTYYVVQTEDGAIDETNFAYKTKADAEHALKLHVKWLTEQRAKKGSKRRK